MPVVEKSEGILILWAARAAERRRVRPEFLSPC